MRIGYCSRRDPYNKKSLSGLDYHMRKALEGVCDEIIPLGPLSSPYTLPGKIFNRLYKRVFNTDFAYSRSPIYAKSLGAALKKKIKQCKPKPDVLYFPNASDVLSYLNEISIPVVYFSDATFKCMDGYYDFVSNLTSLSKRWFNEMERRSLKQADALIYPSHWAAASAVNDYGCPSEKIHVIPCGGNLEIDLTPSLDQILGLEREKEEVLKLLYIGGNWSRKGGSIVLEIVNELNRRGTKTSLIVCGDGPASLKEQDNVEFVGFLDQNKPEDMQRFHKLYIEASIFCVPSRSECFGFVYPEASAFGLPIISTDTGGIPDYVDNGMNGYLLPLESGYKEYADKIENIWTNKKKYKEFSLKSRQKYEAELNWATWGKKVYEVFKHTFEKHVENI